MHDTYTALMAYVRETVALEQISGLLGWDQETMMPRGATAQRGEWMGAIESTLHARWTDPRIGDWLAALDEADLDDTAQANTRNIRRNHERRARVPARLAAEIARVTSVSQGVWAEARRTEDFAAFAPSLKHVLALRREEAAALADDGGLLYDALLNDYEPGMTSARMGALFDGLRGRLVDLRGRISDASLSAPRLEVDFPEALQIKLAAELAGGFGYDWSRGRMDKAVHPFSSGSGTDTRITTRVDVKNPFNCLYSTIHETGHACYEQGIDAAHLLTPLGQGVSMGVHESQSRIYENQLGRSPAFCGWLFSRMRDVFGDFGISGEEDFCRFVNAVGQGFIRTEADEVQYNLHVMMRFDLERAMISGDLEVEGLEAAWNARFEADFGFAVDRPSNGVLQDVHWSVGLMGYFPTYALGNIYAGCLFETMQAALPTLDADLARGETSGATRWLKENVQRFGGLMEPQALIEQASGRKVSEGPLLSYLEQKFAGIYRL